MKLTSDAEIKDKTLQVVRGIIAHNILPGELRKDGGFDFWPGTLQEWLIRIEANWPQQGIPQLGIDPCWFALKK
jgi:hypothetical protein